jgi:hypothetical protein
LPKPMTSGAKSCPPKLSLNISPIPKTSLKLPLRIGAIIGLFFQFAVYT